MPYTDKKAPLTDIAQSLTEDNRRVLNAFLAETGTSPRWYATDSFHVRYRGKMVFRFRIFPTGDWTLNLTVARPEDLDEALLALTGDQRKFYFENLRRCRHCNPRHGNGKRFVILGREYWGCAEPEMEIRNPPMAAVDCLAGFVARRKDNIRAQG